MSVKPLRRQILNDSRRLGPDLELLFLFLIKLVQKLRQAVEVVRAVDHIDPRVLGLELVDDVLLLHHAAADADRKGVSLSQLAPLELSQRTEKALVGVFHGCCMY